MKESDKSANIRQLICDDYILLEEKLPCSHITIICKFFNESDLRNFEEYCNSNELAENLKSYFMAVYTELGFPPYSETTKQLRFHVTVAEIFDSSMPQSNGAHNRLRFVFLDSM